MNGFKSRKVVIFLWMLLNSCTAFSVYNLATGEKQSFDSTEDEEQGRNLAGQNQRFPLSQISIQSQITFDEYIKQQQMQKLLNQQQKNSYWHTGSKQKIQKTSNSQYNTMHKPHSQAENLISQYQYQPNIINNDFDAFNTFKKEKKCGIFKPQVTNYIANGYKTAHREWPWFAQLKITSKDDDESETLCGATLINKKHLLTAAHCFDDMNENNDRIKQTKVLMKGVDLTKKKIQQYQLKQIQLNSDKYKSKSKKKKLESFITLKAKNIFIHPDYVKAMSEREARSKHVKPGPRNDLAIIEIDLDDKEIIDALMPVCMPGEGYQIETHIRCKIMGHGFVLPEDEDTFKIPEDLQMADVHISPNADCRKEVDSLSIKDKINADTMCIRGEIQPCVGDSGGPLICEGFSDRHIDGHKGEHRGEESHHTGEHNGEKSHHMEDSDYIEDLYNTRKWFLTGVTSFAVSTDDKDRCGHFKSAVFGKVSSYIPWIRQIIF